MPRIIVTTDTSERAHRSSVLFDELVHSVHLSTGHAAAQLIERVAWAISEAEGTGTGGPPAHERHRAVRTTTRGGGQRQPIAA